MNTSRQAAVAANAVTFRKEMEWFEKLIYFRAYRRRKLLFEKNKGAEDPDQLPVFSEVRSLAPGQMIDPPLPPEGESPFADFIRNNLFDVSERAAILLGLLPHLVPGAMEYYFSEEIFGALPDEAGCRKTASGKLLPTGETLLYLLAGGDLELRCKLYSLFEEQHPFSQQHILQLSDVEKNEPRLSGILQMENEMIDLFTLGYIRPPGYNSDFPAKRISTQMDWDDLVLSSVTRRQVEEVKIWIRQRERLMGELKMGKRLSPGYKILFFGPPGTGKTLTAQLIGKFVEKDVFRIDLSTVVSKYIGETEKNLAKVFDKAEHSDWILFFDEADALFGSRTKVSSSHDRFANQEVSYLLQRIEDHHGIVILASNMKGNIDDAFMRRFNSVVHFPFPKADERQLLWKKALPEKISLAPDVDLSKVAEKYEMSGAHITNVVAWCSLMALEKGDYLVTESMLREGVSREFAKEGRTI